MKQILSPIISSSGVEIVHRAIADGLEGYHLKTIGPYQALFGPFLKADQERDWDLVHTLPDLGGYMQTGDRPSVVTFHNFYLDGFALDNATPAQRLFYRSVLSRYVARSLQRATVVTAVSRFTAELVKLHFGTPVQVVENGVDCERFLPSADAGHGGRLRVLFVGNLSRRKGKDLLARLAEELADTCEFICASGLRAAAGPEGRGSVRYLGRVDYADMPSVYSGADVLLLPTRREGMSLATLEAMASGLPVVTTNLSSQPELVLHGQGGYTLDIDDLWGMADSLLALARDPQLRREMGAFNRQRAVERYDVRRMVREYAELFDSVCA